MTKPTDNFDLNGKEVVYASIEVDGIDTKDAPDFCDAYATYAEFVDGAALTDDELEQIPSEIIYQRVMDRLY